jgi:hypothetical protein
MTIDLWDELASSLFVTDPAVVGKQRAFLFLRQEVTCVIFNDVIVKACTQNVTTAAEPSEV